MRIYKNVDMGEIKKYEYIDSLRGIAVLLVILVHMNGNPFFPTIINKFIHNGQLGVQLFFIVSAFTLVMSYQNRKDENSREKKFFIRRFFRIAPMYYAVIAFVSIDILSGHNIYNLKLHEINPLELITNIFFINGFFPEYINRYVPGGWSITVEFTFYFILPFLCKKIKDLNSSILFVLISLVLSLIFKNILCEILLVKNPDMDFVYLNFISQLPVFSLGILAYWLLYDAKKDVNASTMFLVGVTILIFCYFEIPYHFVYSLFFMFLLITLAKKPYRFFSNKILAEIGRVSFSVYLLHFLFLNLFNFSFVEGIGFKVAATNFLIKYILVAGVTFLAAQMTYRLIEISGQNVGKKIIKRYLDK